MSSTKFLITPFLKNPLDSCFCINTFRVFKNNVTHIFRLSIYSAWFEDWEQAWAQYFKPLAWSLSSTQSNICDGAFSPEIVNSCYCYNQKQSSGGVLQKRCSYEFCKIHKKTPVVTCVFNEAADLQSLTLSKKEVPTHMFSCEFCKISHNTIFKGPKKLSISAKKRHCTVDVRPGSKYASLSSHEKV